MSDETPKLRDALLSHYNNVKIWFAWIADPEGPSAKKLCTNLLFRWVFGVPIILLGAALVLHCVAFDLMNFIFQTPMASPLQFGGVEYAGGILLFFGASAYYIGKHSLRLELKTAVYNEEIDNLVGEVRMQLHMFDEKEKIEINKVIQSLERYKKMPSEVSMRKLTFLRRIEVKHIRRAQLEAVGFSDLREYEYLVGNGGTFKDYKSEMEKVLLDKSDHGLEKLRKLVENIRDEIDDEKFTIRYGEAILESVIHWSVFAAIAIFYLGLLVLLRYPYFEASLTFIHWGLIGAGGALLATIIRIRNMDTFVVGEDEGNRVLRQMVLGVFLGAASAVLLYVAINTGFLGGRALPALNPDVGPTQPKIVLNALSVLWAIIAGFSGSGFVERLIGSGERVIKSS